MLFRSLNALSKWKRALPYQFGSPRYEEALVRSPWLVHHNKRRIYLGYYAGCIGNNMNKVWISYLPISVKQPFKKTPKALITNTFANVHGKDPSMFKIGEKIYDFGICFDAPFYEKESFEIMNGTINFFGHHVDSYVTTHSIGDIEEGPEVEVVDFSLREKEFHLEKNE